jgi:acyl-CoA hydrolase
MTPPRLDPDAIASVLPTGGRVLVSGCSGESLVLAGAVARAGGKLGAMTFTGIFVPGLNTVNWLANPACRIETFFMTPELKASGKATKFLPFCYGDILSWLRSIRIDAALMMLSRPDADGICSFGPVVDFLAELWPDIPVRIAHINPRLPGIASPCGIPFDSLTAYVEAEQELLGSPDPPQDAASQAIGEAVSRFVPDGATIQTGLGKIPTAALHALKGRRNLKIHSGLIPEATVDLEDAGALAPGISMTGGVAIGSRRLYERVGRPEYRFHPVSYTHSPGVLAQIESFVTLNSAMEVDLFGQAYAEVGPTGLVSGAGGASDFARGARAAGGLRIVALASSANRGAVSRIVAPAEGAGPVSLGRMETDIIVTEHGAADLRGLDHDERALSLIGVASPAHRERLVQRWAEVAAKF